MSRACGRGFRFRTRSGVGSDNSCVGYDRAALILHLTRNGAAIVLGCRGKREDKKPTYCGNKPHENLLGFAAKSTRPSAKQFNTWVESYHQPTEGSPDFG
jgi:hypothetical protein